MLTRTVPYWLVEGAPENAPSRRPEALPPLLGADERVAAPVARGLVVVEPRGLALLRRGAGRTDDVASGAGAAPGSTPSPCAAGTLPSAATVVSWVAALPAPSFSPTSRAVPAMVPATAAVVRRIAILQV